MYLGNNEYTWFVDDTPSIIGCTKFIPCPKILGTGTHDWVMGFWMWSHVEKPSNQPVCYEINYL